jgi:hypothetical protein
MAYDGSVGIMLRIDREICVRFPSGAIDFFLFLSVPICSGIHPASYSMSMGFFPGRQSSRSLSLATHFHLVPKLTTQSLSLSYYVSDFED